MRQLWTILAISFCSCAGPNCKMVLRTMPKHSSELAQLDEPKPRCSAEDPQCGPEPVRDGEPVCFEPMAPRERLPPGDELPAPPARGSVCSHDGECLIAGCGNACVRYPFSRVETNCKGFAWLDDRALCGCVEGSCSFFKQDH
jgi:hypothetical protein